MNFEEMFELYKGWKELDEAAKKAGYAYLAMKGWNRKPKWHATITSVDFDDEDEDFTIEFEGGCGCCPPDTFGREYLPWYAIWDTESFLVEAKLRGDFD